MASGNPAGRASPVLTFDIGGTSIRAGVFDPATGALVRSAHCATPNYLIRPGLGAEALLAELFVAIRNLGGAVMKGARPDAVIVGYPGPVTASGIALRSPTILGSALDRAHDVGAEIRAIWPTARVRVLNDLTCAGYSFVAQGCLDFCVITVGSGIGNKVFLGGAPMTGTGGRGGEIGHLRVQPGAGPPRFEDELGNIASGRGTLGLAQQWRLIGSDESASERPEAEAFTGGGELDSVQLARAFRAGDRRAHRIVEAASHPLATAIGTIHLAIGLESFFIVGGFAKALGPAYVDVLVRKLRRLTWDLDQKWEQMVKLGRQSDEEVLLGAAYVAAATAIPASIGDREAMAHG